MNEPTLQQERAEELRPGEAAIHNAPEDAEVTVTASEHWRLHYRHIGVLQTGQGVLCLRLVQYGAKSAVYRGENV